MRSPAVTSSRKYRRALPSVVPVRLMLAPDRRIEMMERTQRRTVPQIYVDDYHVGGYDELSELDREGRLDPLLRGKEASA